MPSFAYASKLISFLLTSISCEGISMETGWFNWYISCKTSYLAIIFHFPNLWVNWFVLATYWVDYDLSILRNIISWAWVSIGNFVYSYVRYFFLAQSLEIFLRYIAHLSKVWKTSGFDCHNRKTNIDKRKFENFLFDPCYLCVKIFSFPEVMWMKSQALRNFILRIERGLEIFKHI